MKRSNADEWTNVDDCRTPRGVEAENDHFPAVQIHHRRWIHPEMARDRRCLHPYTLGALHMRGPKLVIDFVLIYIPELLTAYTHSCLISECTRTCWRDGVTTSRTRQCRSHFPSRYGNRTYLLLLLVNSTTTSITGCHLLVT